MKYAVVAAVSLSMLLAASCSRPAPTTVQVDPALSILIPPDTTLVAAANLESLKKTPLYQKYLQNRSLPQVDQFGHFTGIDPRKDLWQVLALSDGKHSTVLARGNFQSDMETRLERDGAKVLPYKMYHLVGSEEASVVFLNTSTAAVGSVDSLKNLLDTRGKTNGPPPALVALMKDIPNETQFWAAYLGTGKGLNLPFPLPGNWANLNRLLGSVQSGSFYVDLRDGLKMSAVANTPGENEGKQLNDALKGMVGIGRLSLPDNQPDLLRAFDGMKVTQNARSVSLRVEESAELVEKLLNFAGVH